jgi:type IV secretion system protein TrbJ
MQHALREMASGAMALLLIIAPAAPARAQMSVIDPTNLAQNLLQATRALEQINNQIRQIEQQTQMLAQNPLQLSPELSQSIGQARELFSAAQGLTFQVDQMSGQLRDLYPETWEDFDLAEIGERTRVWSHENRAAIERALEAQARAAHALEATQDQINRALQSSANAEGQTGAAQAGNQLLGLTTAQLTQIHALLIAQGRALETERLERVSREERAREIQRRAFPTQSDVTVDPARSAFND